MNLLKEVIKGIKPDKTVLKEVDATLNKINKAIAKNKIKAKAVAGGSVAKCTFLKGDYDVDIFVKFNYKYKDDDLSKLLGRILRGFKSTKVHGSRDYYQIRNKLVFEIVPVLDITDPKKAVNVTDMSPLHVAWVKKNSMYVDEIRLSKAFCKAQGCYGAESYIRGFSGHVLDILTIYYKGFLNLLKAAKKWKQFDVVDFYNIYKGKARDELNQSKISPLIAIDPILPERNAAAALSTEKFELFKRTAAEFLVKPSKQFFVKKEFSVDEIKSKAKGNKLITVEVTPLKGKEDIVGTKLLKAFEFIQKQLAIYEFKVIDSNWNWSKKAIFYFIMDKKELPEIKDWRGPPLGAKERVMSFKKKHKTTYVKENKIFAKVKRKYTKPEALAKDLIKDEYVKDRVKCAVIKLWQEY